VQFRNKIQEDLLRAITAVENIIQWDSSVSVSTDKADSMTGKTYDVIIYQSPPFVDISGKEGIQDPGNALQTRTPKNGQLTGITISLLSKFEDETGAVFRYFYPCRKAKYDAKTGCNDADLRSKDAALEMMDSVTCSGAKPPCTATAADVFYGPAGPEQPVCQGGGQCLVAGW
jgi:hypothetical protein